MYKYMYNIHVVIITWEPHLVVMIYVNNENINLSFYDKQKSFRCCRKTYLILQTKKKTYLRTTQIFIFYFTF